MILYVVCRVLSSLFLGSDDMLFVGVYMACCLQGCMICCLVLVSSFL